MAVLEEMTSCDLRRLLERGVRTVVIPFGSVEHHGGHLALGADAVLADMAGKAVADRLDAALAPTVRVGCADQHMHGAGTLTVSAETLRAAALSMAGSLVAHGFRVLVLLSTHGGNQAVLENTAQELGRQYNDVVVCAPRGDVGPAPGSHSGRWLTSVMLLVRPDLVDVDAAHEDIKDEVRAASLERGRENLERFVSSIVQAVRDAT